MPNQLPAPFPTASVMYTAWAACIIVLLAVVPALAHKVNIFAYVEGNVVYTESYFSDGKPVEEATIEAATPSGEIIVEGKTDNQGYFSFSLPAQKEDLTIVLNASLGHKSSYLLKKEEM